MKDQSADNGTVQSIQTMFDIVEFLKENGEGGVTETANELDIAKSTVHRYLSTLKQLGYAVKNPETDTYRLGLRFIGIGSHVQNAEQLYQMAQQKAEQLAEQTGERAQFIVEENGYGYYVHWESGEHAVRTGVREGKQIPLSSTAAGKAILAHLPRWRIEQIIDRRGLSQNTHESIASEDELYNRLEEIRERGYAYNTEEHIDGLYAIGAPIRRGDGTVLGALSVSGPTHRVKDRISNNEITTMLLGEVNELELNLEYS